jgi:hypothetical protein
MLVLGGLVSEEAIQNVNGVPGLSRIPLLGNLFKNRRSTKTKRNLMIFLRPMILRDAATEASVSSEKYNFLRAEQLRMRENRELEFREQQPLLPELPPSGALIPDGVEEVGPAVSDPAASAPVPAAEAAPAPQASERKRSRSAPRRVPGRPAPPREAVAGAARD